MQNQTGLFREHKHTFGQEHKRPGELRTIIVVIITAVMMIIEIAAGLIFGSMALLADGLHMASHAAALSINAFAYIYSRKHAHDRRYSFGTGKINALGGFTGAVLLIAFALAMAWGSFDRLIHPVSIAYNQAIFVAILGLIVNGISLFVLDHRGHEHGDDVHEDNQNHDDHHHTHRHDHNLRSAYLHVLADALTSFTAIFALLAAKYLGLVWMDPVMGFLGAVLVSRWSLGLLFSSSSVLLDVQEPHSIQEKIKNSIESNSSNRVADLHLWSIGPAIYGLILTVVTNDPKPPEHYKKLLPSDLILAHITIEVHNCLNCEDYADRDDNREKAGSEPDSRP